MKMTDLYFLKGSWQGEGFVMDFTEPIHTMLFGSMQAANEKGVTIYWETFRFEIVDDCIYLYTVTIGKDSGVYVLNKNISTTHHILFDGYENYDQKAQQILFSTLNAGIELVLGVKGLTNDKEAYEQQWKVQLRS